MASILRYLAYLQFLPLLAQLVSFVREAEAKFKSPGSGASKSIWVRDQFAALVNTAQATGLITPTLASTLIAGAGSIIDIIVAVFNASGGVPVPDAPPVDPPAVAPPPSADIYKTVHTYVTTADIPDNAAQIASGAKVGDTVRLGAGSSKVWRLFPKDAPADLRYPPAPEEPHYFLTVS